jgi:Protein of unknown function (DUF2752)
VSAATLASLRAPLEADGRDLRVAGGLMLGAGLLLPFLPEGAGIPCPLRAITGVPCPLCGMTTSVTETLRLDLADALAANPAGIAAVTAAALLLVVRPARVRVSAPLVYVTLVALWLFELHRFGFL